MSLGTALLIGADCEARSQLNKSLYERKYFSFTREIDCSKDAVAIINHFQPDFLFTEVDLGDKDAFSLLEKVSYMPKVIFISQNDQFAGKALEWNAVDYLQKPFTELRFQQMINRCHIWSEQPESASIAAKDLQSTYPAKIFLNDGKRYLGIFINDIIYIKASKEYTIVYTKDRQYLSSKGISEIERALNPDIFIRLHRSYIVNLDHITSAYRDISRNFVSLSNGEELPVGRHFAERLKVHLY